MNCTPPLGFNNRYSVLEVDDNDYFDSPPPIEAVPTPPDPIPRPASSEWIRVPAWERKRVPKSFTIAGLPSQPSRSLELHIELRTTDTGAEYRTRALVDSGATGSFIDREFVRRNRIATRKLARPVPVLNVDGSQNEAGHIEEVVDLIVRYKRHAERLLLAVTGLGKKSVILGYTWLREHNPEINWESGEVKLSRCPRRCAEC